MKERKKVPFYVTPCISSKLENNTVKKIGVNDQTCKFSTHEVKGQGKMGQRMQCI